VVNFSVFNELSFRSIDISNNIEIQNSFELFFKLLKRLDKIGLSSIRMDKDFKNYEITEGITFYQFFNTIKDRDFRERLIQFITKDIITIDFPLIKSDEGEYEQLLENEYFYKEKSTLGGLACADIWNTLAVSFNSNKEWNTKNITLQKQTLLIDRVVDINIKHASKVEHLTSHQGFFEQLEEENKQNITQDNFWERREEFFPNKIVFCKEVEKQVKSLDSQIFQQTIAMLRDIELNNKKPSDYDNTPESPSVCNNKKFKSMRIFTIKNIKIQFNHHIKYSSHRMYFLVHKKKIYIGYIGKHLPTKKFPK
jgi:hypothetical protein